MTTATQPQPVSKVQLLSVRECAELAGCSVWKMKRRLLKLHREYGDILHSFQEEGKPVRKWLVNPVALQLMRQSRATTEQLEELREAVKENTHRIEGLKGAHVSHRRRTAKWQRKVERRLEGLRTVQEGQAKTLQSVAQDLANVLELVKAWDCED